ncbi:MAG: rhomboid family intramembrane serine protease [Bacteroidota bacterium]|nr:rhomboid family intramembrane serine protease [Bacteroidota bacterium]
MFFPIGDDQIHGGKKPIFAYSLIFVNILVFIYEINLGREGSEVFLMSYGAIPQEVIQGQDLYTLISCMFLHGGWIHLIGNMLFLWVFADNIETIVGSINFMLFYVLGGLVASATHIFFNPYSEIPMIGASGAISAVMGAYLILFPSSRVRVFIIFLLSSVYIPSIFFLGFWIIQQMVAGVGSLNSTGEESTGVAWWAHIGGFVFGVLAGFIARSSFRHKYRYKYAEEEP